MYLDGGGKRASRVRELLDRDQAATGAWIASGRLRLGADPRAAADTQALSDRVNRPLGGRRLLFTIQVHRPALNLIQSRLVRVLSLAQSPSYASVPGSVLPKVRYQGEPREPPDFTKTVKELFFTL